jgi:exodeoxyribonuclease VII large subunit
MEIAPHSVSAYLKQLNIYLQKAQASVVGEVSQVNDRGHVYFTIKDQQENAVLECIMWKSRYQYSGVALEVGQEVLLRGKPSVYAPMGKMSFVADSIELVGEGALKKAYDTLKAKLQAEGVFASEKKRLIPDFVKTIGVVTSAHGAVIHDFMNNLGRNGFKVKLMHTTVEGAESGKEIIMSLRAFKKQDIDVLVLIRGGGSMQSLVGFDNEVLVREIAAYPVPVLAGIGHHEDVTLASLAADLTASTPSIVATSINESWTQARQVVETSEQLIASRYATALRDTKDSLQASYEAATTHLEQFFAEYEKIQNFIEYRLGALSESVKNTATTLDSYCGAFVHTISRTITTVRERTEAVESQVFTSYTRAVKDTHKEVLELEKSISFSNPERQLSLGYSILRKNGKIVKKVAEIQSEDQLEVQLGDGVITTKAL